MNKCLSSIKFGVLSSLFLPNGYYYYGDKMRQLFTSVLSQVFFHLLLLIFLFHFGLVGAAIGALIGFKNKMNFLQILMCVASGILMSHNIIMVTFDHFLHSDHADLRGYFLRLIDIISEDSKPVKLLRDQDNMFLTTKVAGCEKLIKLPKIKMSNQNIFDTYGNKTCCSVCLQDFEVGNSAGIFPKCGHKFHPECISQWLLTNNSCPVCRTTI